MSREKNQENSSASPLPAELQTKLNFQYDSTGQWLVYDHFEEVGGLRRLELLPAQVRVSSDGTRHEIGSVREDLEGLLALAKIIHPEAQEIDHVLNFWNGTRFSTKEEAGMVYLGAAIEPTTAGFEGNHTAMQLAYDVAISAAFHNLSREQILQNKHKKHLIEQALIPSGRAVLFEKEKFTRFIKGAGRVRHSADRQNLIIVNTLREYPLSTPRVLLSFIPGLLTRNGQQKELNGSSSAMIMDYNGGSEVFITSLDSWYNDEEERWENDCFRLLLPIPGDAEIRNIGDLQQLSFAKWLDDDFKVARELDVSIQVEDDEIRLDSEDGSLGLILRKPVCNDCGIPTWRFPFPQEGVVAKSEVGNFYTTNTSDGILRFLVETPAGEKTYCADCIPEVVEQYLADHPFVRKARALEVFRRRLDLLGYQDVDLWEEQTWHMGKYWECQTKIEYERGGRKILRNCGAPTLSDDGVFEANMFPREYVDFRR